MTAHADFFAWVFWLLSKTNYTGYNTKKNKIYQKMLILLR